jgi:Methylase of chemotaxis methyl-accepting proteins
MDFLEFEKWVYKEMGINLSAYKPNQLHRRIESLMSRVGVKNLQDYKVLLTKDKEQKQRFLDFITINVTEFFRNPEMFSQLEDLLKKEFVKNPSLKVWSAACSIGCEPYSLGIIMENIGYKGKLTLLATDIDKTILSKAQLGQYTENEIKNVNSTNLDKYFSKVNDKYFIKDEIKKKITFQKQDLILDNYDSNFDIIVCRNVVIYFNNDTKDKIYEKFSRSLKKGGLLFVGATETIYDYKKYGFEKASTFIYRKL